MPGIREIKKRVKAIKKTKQITKAMYTISTIRFKKAQEKFISFSNYIKNIERITRKIISYNIIHPFFSEKEIPLEAIVIISSDKGLCGSFNSNLFRKTLEIINEKNKQVNLITIGRKAKEFFKRYDYPILQSYVNIFSSLDFKMAQEIAEYLIELFLYKNISKISLIYNSFKTVMQTKIIYEEFLPLKKGIEELSDDLTCIFEPSFNDIFNFLIPQYLRSKIYHVLLDSNVSEHAIRMTMMDQASENAEELINKLTLLMNKARQAAITKELTEISTSAEVLRK